MLTIQRYKTSEIAVNSALYKKLLSIVAERYATAEHTFRYGLDFSTDVYCAFLNDECCGFCMIAYKNIRIDEASETASLYMGLAVRKEDNKFKTVIFHLMKKILYDAAEFRNTCPSDIPVWATTSSPAVFSAFHSAFIHVEPALDGAYSDEGAFLADAIKKQYYKVTANAHPFVLHSQSKTLYSDREHLAVQNKTTMRGYKLFKELNIDDAAGDRILMIGRLKND
ncbi:MAG: hypothetical protein WCM76_07090 [Bacteroidota bacterium]